MSKIAASPTSWLESDVNATTRSGVSRARAHSKPEERQNLPLTVPVLALGRSSFCPPHGAGSDRHRIPVPVSPLQSTLTSGSQVPWNASNIEYASPFDIPLAVDGRSNVHVSGQSRCHSNCRPLQAPTSSTEHEPNETRTPNPLAPPPPPPPQSQCTSTVHCQMVDPLQHAIQTINDHQTRHAIHCQRHH